LLSEISGVTGYEWQVDTDDGGNILAGFSGTTNAMKSVCRWKPVAYLWRVRAVTRNGRWSAVWKFTTILAVKRMSPTQDRRSGHRSGKPVLQWNAGRSRML
jgi:predicted secreted protein